MSGAPSAPARTGEPRRLGLRFGLGLLALIVFLSIAAPWLSGADPTYESIDGLGPLGEPLGAGAPGHLLGTDPKGRDLLARVLFGGRTTLITAVTAVGIATIAGLIVGLLAANSRRTFGEILMRCTDLGLAIPGLLLAAAIVTILGRSMPSLIIGLAAVFWAPMSRVTYGQAIVLREREYVEAANECRRARVRLDEPQQQAAGRRLARA